MFAVGTDGQNTAPPSSFPKTTYHSSSDGKSSHNMFLAVWLVSTLPHVFHGTDLIVNENGIFVSSTGQHATDDDLYELAREPVRHWWAARRALLTSALRSWKSSQWELV